MKFTKNSKALMKFFLEQKCINNVPQTKKTQHILQRLFHEIKTAHHYIETIKKREGVKIYKLAITKISSIHQIPKPTQFNADSFPTIIREHIDENSAYDLSYTFSLLDREINIHFIVEDEDVELYIDEYNAYLEKIYIWFYLINDYSSKECAKKLTIFLYLTSLKKELPTSNVHILDQIHVNTAFTYTCPVVSEIVIFRKEEWFKVLLHESFHNFALDFSDMNTNECTKRMLDLFPVDSKVNLFEAYTEFWAEILNCVFCSYFSMKNKEDINEFLEACDFFINFERTYSFFQLTKILHFMGLTYKNLYLKNSELERNTLYKEKTNVLSYYVITLILLNNYQGVFEWCDKNNLSLLQFKKTTSNLNKFCLFIEKNYKTKGLLDGISCMQKLLNRLHYNDRVKGKNMKFILNNMHMSICEMA